MLRSCFTKLAVILVSIFFFITTSLSLTGEYNIWQLTVNYCTHQLENSGKLSQTLTNKLVEYYNTAGENSQLATIDYSRRIQHMVKFLGAGDTDKEDEYHVGKQTVLSATVQTLCDQSQK